MILTAGARHPKSNILCCERALVQLQRNKCNFVTCSPYDKKLKTRAEKFEVNHLESIESSFMKSYANAPVYSTPYFSENVEEFLRSRSRKKSTLYNDLHGTGRPDVEYIYDTIRDTMLSESVLLY